MTLIRKILIANRGAIAVRIIQACQKRHIQSVAVYSSADSNGIWLSQADQAVAIGGAASSESYLNQDSVISAALISGADAIHPGYGFLAENAEFAQRVIDAGLTWIGPSPSAMIAMASKQNARDIAVEQQIPVIPGAHGDDQQLTKAAQDMGAPVLLKASAGGGGIGMRIVDDLGQLPSAIISAKQEAKNAFGDDSLIVEKYLHPVRHIEVQILADQHGNTVHLHERECSLQRRRQKIIEEAPSSNINQVLKDQLFHAAVSLAKSVDYVGAGTVEFVVDNNDKFYFLEMNTRLQVEHGITEAITGIDIVQWQIRIAEGETLGLSQPHIQVTGHAIEARLYAEDPSQNFLPQPGLISFWQPAQGENLRTDSGIQSGGEISSHYDPMLAKLIAYGDNRKQASRSLAYHLRQSSFIGPRCNQNLLIDLLHSDGFTGGETYTHSVEAWLPSWQQKMDDKDLLVAACIYYQRQQTSPYWPGEAEQNLVTDCGLSVTIKRAGEVTFSANFQQQNFTISLTEMNSVSLTATINSLQQNYHWAINNSEVCLQSKLRGPSHFIFSSDSIDDIETNTSDHFSSTGARVLEILVSPGQLVHKGDILLTLEAMKMESPVLAKQDGQVKQIHVQQDLLIDANQLLVELTEEAQ